MHKMDLSNVVFPRKLLKEFILMYRDSPCLWKRDCLSYKNKKKRHDAISKLTELVQQYDGCATRVHVLRKIESLRACVRREHKRVVDSRRNSNSEEIYVPQLWYYDLFSFIFNDHENNYKKAEPNDQSAESEEEQEEILGDDEPSFETHSYTDYSNIAVDMDSGSSKGYVNYTEEPTKSEKRQWKEVEDEYDAIGINVAAKLRSLGPTMRILAEKLINDVLFQAQLNGLNSTTTLSTTDPFKQDHH
ncbi:uncharacterized protein LOC106132646 isoform X2 [Amyelois transitella]|uniref:uncharacterized protein LOC106132646 isoform X2 n=1 Tax=Amyelois transitella TaxID=680683 RepID=UPI00067AC39A|nr:uncharacterized protein LOC106132646 isoform X2 [Amyelois transitella]